MSIFNDKFYENPDINAYLNWRTDAPIFASFYDVGVGYLSSSIITLQSIINNKNEGSEADSIIFPIMFNLWHGIELMLKSGILLIGEVKRVDNKFKSKGHKIDILYNLFIEELNSFTLTQPQKDLKVLKDLIDEFNNQNVRFDAFRYPNDSNWNEQFYNTPDNNYVENKCVNLFDLQKKCLEIIENLPRTIKFIEDTIISDGNNISALNDNYYNKYKKDELFTEKDYEKDEDPFTILLRYLRYTM